MGVQSKGNLALSPPPHTSFRKQHYSLDLIMRVPRIIRRVEAAKKDEKHHRVKGNPALADTRIAKKAKRADKLRAMAGAFSAEAAVVSPNPLEGKYHVQECIGQGKEGVIVSRCTSQASGRSFAVKRVPKRLQKLQSQSQWDETKMQPLLLQSTHLLSVHEVLHGADASYSVMDHAAGGDLFEWIRTHGALSEAASKSTFTGILSGLHQLHNAGFIHRDLKPENVLLMQPEPTADNVRLADFEFCCSPPAVGPVGSVAYAAPETIDSSQTYGPAVDMWAAGVVLYMMLSASAPYEGVAGHVDFEEPCWNDISPSAKHLIQGLLQHDPSSRLTLEGALLHPWLSVDDADMAPAMDCEAPSPTSEPAPAPRPKFSIRCTWHSKEKKWSNMGGDGASNEVPMFLESDCQPATPFVSLPLEWQPKQHPATARTLSM